MGVAIQGWIVWVWGMVLGLFWFLGMFFSGGGLDYIGWVLVSWVTSPDVHAFEACGEPCGAAEKFLLGLYPFGDMSFSRRGENSS